MAAPEKSLALHVSSGKIDGTGALLTVLAGFRPKAVFISNTSGLVKAYWNDLMPDAAMVKNVDAGVAGTVAMTNHSDSAGTPSQATGASAALNSAPTVTIPNGVIQDAIGFDAGGALVTAKVAGGAITTNNPGITVTQATYNALASHSHANTAAFTGTAGGMSYVTVNGITPMIDGFKVGADADLNVAAEVLFWTAIK